MSARSPYCSKGQSSGILDPACIRPSRRPCPCSFRLFLRQPVPGSGPRRLFFNFQSWTRYWRTCRVTPRDWTRVRCGRCCFPKPQHRCCTNLSETRGKHESCQAFFGRVRGCDAPSASGGHHNDRLLWKWSPTPTGYPTSFLEAARRGYVAAPHARRALGTHIEEAIVRHGRRRRL